MSAIAIFKLLKITSLVIVLIGAFVFRHRILSRPRTVILVALWMSASLCFLFLRGISNSDHHEKLEIVAMSIAVLTPLFTIYWIFKSIKDWLDPSKNPGKV
ncbi:hypothetical protein [Comamonas testosteroni]|uniref:hypothetical protein n=1 Tax=Comamonas testosteroni TaxID=285 RepID=UPI002DB7E33A|nr:hypothetical protein [Comamonas testosteroni]MEB5964507.1 hypothetical protein [Comamonas testosteroni]